MVHLLNQCPGCYSCICRTHQSCGQWHSRDSKECPQTRVGFIVVQGIHCSWTLSHPISQSVKRIVITSSGAAILRDSPTPSTFSELDWNEQCLEIVKEKGRDAPNMMKYRASKTLAEKGMVSSGLMHTHRESIFVSLQPPGISGTNTKLKSAGTLAFLIPHLSVHFLSDDIIT